MASLKRLASLRSSDTSVDARKRQKVTSDDQETHSSQPAARDAENTTVFPSEKQADDLKSDAVPTNDTPSTSTLSTATLPKDIIMTRLIPYGLFDCLVYQEQTIGISIELSVAGRPATRFCTAKGPSGACSELSRDYRAAARRRINRLMRGRQGSQMLHWDALNFTMANKRTEGTGDSKTARYITARVPIAEGCQNYQSQQRKCVEFTFVFDNSNVPDHLSSQFSCIYKYSPLCFVVRHFLSALPDEQDRVAFEQAKAIVKQSKWRGTQQYCHAWYQFLPKVSQTLGPEWHNMPPVSIAKRVRTELASLASHD